MYEQVIQTLRAAYDRKVEERAQRPLAPWKVAERQHFLDLLRTENKQTLLEIGAGAGHDCLFFQAHGLAVTAIDLSPAMVAHCRSQGLDAHVMDYAHITFAPESFDALYAVNCLLHVPKRDLPGILAKLALLLKADGLFYLGQYGGVDQEGVWEEDHYEPKRFYARYLDEQLQAVATEAFDLVAFRAVPVEETHQGHFQSMVLRKRGPALRPPNAV
ncbi:MAG: methyltransferase domain-containing protein [Caldilineaceae bacterium]|nr:methyltransferase domain-containing protein [Caldilineaceae bacterium]